MNFLSSLFSRKKPAAPPAPGYVQATPPALNSPFTQAEMKLRMDRFEADARRAGDLRGVRRAQSIKQVWGV